MPRRISTLLRVSSKDLDKKGAFDGFIDVDSRLHVDPSLLAECGIPEFRHTHEEFEKYFNDVLTLIANSKAQGDKLWKEALKRLHFKEIGNTALGYSRTGTGGNAIGAKLAAKILETVSQIVAAGIRDPVIFELVGMFEEGIGADRISDMTINILTRNFALYTQRVARELKIKTASVRVRGDVFQLPHDPSNNTPILLLPKSLLNHLPIAMDWDDVDRVCKYNDELRQKVNKVIGDSWKAASRAGKYQLKKLILENPELLRDLIKQYKEKPKASYDFANDPLGELMWAELSENAPKTHPLNLSQYSPVTADNILDVVRKICEQYASLIENNGWFEYLYDAKGKLKPERASQLLFYGIAEVYCMANNLDLSRETNAGVGSLDFKLSRGFSAKVNVEVKYSTNPGLIKGFEKQLPAYNKAEKTSTSIYLIIQTQLTRKNIDTLLKIANRAKDGKERVPEIIVIDGQKQVSASKRK